MAPTEFAKHVTRLLECGKADDPTIVAAAAPIAAVDRGLAEDGFWVAVLPFKCANGNSDLAAIAEALAEEIVTGLCRFSYLRVIARSS